MTARQLFKIAHRAARVDFYAVADFPGFGAAAQKAVSASRDPYVERALGQRATLQQAAAQIRASRGTEFGALLLG